MNRLAQLLYRLKGTEGFSLLELSIVMGVTAILFTIVTINLVKVQRTSTVSAQVQTLLSDIKQQQLKAMVGATEGRAANDTYGIYIQSTKYTLFHGMIYTSSDSSNFPIPLDLAITLATTFPNGLLIFSRQSGEVVSWTSGKNTITLTNTSGTEQKTLTINRYGVVTGIQ